MIRDISPRNALKLVLRGLGNLDAVTMWLPIPLFLLVFSGLATAQLEIPADIPINRPKSSQGTEIPGSDYRPQTQIPSSRTEFRRRTSMETEPGPDGLNINYPSTVRTGERVIIAVETSNAFQDVYIGTIAVSIEGGDPLVPPGNGAYDVLLPNGKNKIARFYRDGEVWRRGDITYPSQTHVEIYDEKWLRGAAKTLSFPVEFREAGTVSLLIRATFSVTQDKKTVVEHNFPHSSEVIDEQGFPCQKVNIRVEE